MSGLFGHSVTAAPSLTRGYVLIVFLTAEALDPAKNVELDLARDFPAVNA